MGEHGVGDLPAPDGERDLHRLGREVSEHLRVGVERASTARARLGEDRFLDVHHRELVADPLGTVRRDLRRSSTSSSTPRSSRRSSMAQPTAPAPTAPTATPPEQFGLTDAQFRSDYDFYIRHFDIDLEG